MPLYEYECEVCNHRFEVIQKYSDAPIATCPVCGGAVIKLFSSPAIQFKGSGFYITDYARAGKSDSGSAGAGKGDKSESTASSDSKESSSKSAESSSDSKAESKASKTSKTESPTPAAPAAKSSSD